MFDDLPQTIIDELCMQYGLNDFDKSLVKTYITLPESDRIRIKDMMKLLIQNSNILQSQDEDTPSHNIKTRGE